MRFSQVAGVSRLETHLVVVGVGHSSLSPPLPGGLGPILDPLDQITDVDVGARIDLVPIELLRVRGGASVAASPAGEELAVVLGASWDSAVGESRQERRGGDDGSFAVDRRQRVDVPRRSDVELVLRWDQMLSRRRMLHVPR